MVASTLVEKTQQKIRAMIVNKEYDHNNFLPSEGELCDRFGVSRVTVREAVRSMEVRGLVRRVHGKGIEVINNSVKVMTQFINDMVSLNFSDLLEVIEVRTIVENEAAGMAAERALPEDIEKMLQDIEVMENAVTMDDDYYTHDLQFHVDLVRAARNKLLTTLVAAYTPLLKDVVVTSSQLDYVIEQRHHFHRNIFDAIVARDGAKAKEMMRLHLKVNRENFDEYTRRRSLQH